MYVLILSMISIYLFITVLSISFLAAYLLSKVPSNIVRALVVFSFSLCVYLFGYLLEINSTSLEMMYFWNQIQYMTLPFLPGLWLLFSLLYVKKDHILTLKSLILIFSIPLLTFFMRLTNSYHNLFYSSVESIIQSGFPILYLEKGPWYFVHSLYIFIAFLMVFVLYAREYYRAGSMRRRQYGIILIASLIPLLGLLLIILDLGGLGIDYAALLLPISFFLMMFIVFQYDFLSLKSLARETVFEKSVDALFLMDDRHNLIDSNSMARDVMRALGVVESEKMDKSIFTLLQQYGEEDLRISTEEGVKYYELQRVDLKDDFQQPVGTLLQLGDMTQRKEDEEALRLSEEKYRLLAEKMSDVMWVLDLEGERVRYVSPSILNLSGYRVHEVQDRRIEEILTPPSYQYFLEVTPVRIEAFQRGVDEGYTDEVELLCKDGRVIILEIKGRIIYNQLTDHLEYMGVSRDITEKKLAQERLKEMATTDELTGLYNRRHFLELAQKEFHRCQRYDENFSLLMIDIDDFKAINDTYGHAGGDSVLRSLGEKMKSFFRSSDLQGRLGGEEFAVLLINASLEEGYLRAERFRETIKESPLSFEEKKIYYTLSIGVTPYNKRMEHLDELFKMADRGLYKAKERGKDCTIKEEIE